MWVDGADERGEMRGVERMKKEEDVQTAREYDEKGDIVKLRRQKMVMKFNPFEGAVTRQNVTCVKESVSLTSSETTNSSA